MGRGNEIIRAIFFRSPKAGKAPEQNLQTSDSVDIGTLLANIQKNLQEESTDAVQAAKAATAIMEENDAMQLKKYLGPLKIAYKLLSGPSSRSFVEGSTLAVTPVLMQGIGLIGFNIAEVSTAEQGPVTLLPESGFVRVSLRLAFDSSNQVPKPRIRQAFIVNRGSSTEFLDISALGDSGIQRKIIGVLANTVYRSQQHRAVTPGVAS